MLPGAAARSAASAEPISRDLQTQRTDEASGRRDASEPPQRTTEKTDAAHPKAGSRHRKRDADKTVRKADRPGKTREQAAAPIPGTAATDQPATSGAQPSRIEGAHLDLLHATHDFGDVPRKGGDLVHEFPFVNDGTVPLVVTRVVTSCSCLKASFSKRPVAPGEAGVIRIMYEPHKSEPGTFNKVIQVYSNSVDGRDVITVQGNSIEGQPRKVKTDRMKIKYAN